MMEVSGVPDKKKFIVISIKNISASPLNCNPDELTERFIRGDVSSHTDLFPLAKKVRPVRPNLFLYKLRVLFSLRLREGEDNLS